MCQNVALCGNGLNNEMAQGQLTVEGKVRAPSNSTNYVEKKQHSSFILWKKKRIIKKDVIV